MAECSYARCLQERRLIKRELMKWSKDMLHIVGLERVAEELMERMKWKNYQETLTRTHSNTDQVTASAEQQHTTQRQNDRARDHQNVPQTLNSNKTQQALTAEALHADPEVKGHRQPADEGSEGKQLHKRADYNDAFAVEIANNATTTTSHIHSQSTSNSNNSISNGNINNCNSNNTPTIVNAKASLQIATNITKTSSNGVNESSARRNAYSVPPAQPQPPPESEPVDWKPNEKCHFCVDGKLLTVNAKGELVAESGLAVAESDQGPRLDTDSDSNESSNLASSAAVGGSLLANNNNININSNNNINRVNLNKLLTSRLTELPANMTSMDSMAAQLAVMQTFSDYPNFNWLQLVQQQQQQQQQQHTAQPSSAATPATSDTSAAAVSPSLKGSPSPSDATGEQPLDLSSKPSPNSSISGDLNTVRSNTSRVTPTPTARRTYTDDDLNNAMQDIISGRLGARKAADQYNVPRSTLRNKVNRLAMGVKRANVHMPPELLHELEMDKELSGDDGGDDSNVSTPQPENQPALEELASRIATSSTLRQLCANNGNYAATRADSDTSASANLSPKLNAARTDGGKRETATPTSTAPPQSQPQASPQLQLPPMLIDSGMLIQLVLAAGNLNALQAPRLDQPVTLRDILLHLKDALEGRAAAAVGDGALNNGKPSIFDQPLLLQKLQQQPTPPYSHRLPKSETPETTSSLDPNETADDPSAILKIPSYKPAAGTSGAARASCSPSLLCNNNANAMPNRNGDSPNSAPSPRIANSMLAAAVAAVGGSGASAAANRQPNDMPVISPPLLHRHNRDSQSPQSFSFRDVIANSIHRTMNEQVNQDAHAAATASMFGLGLDVERTNSSGGASDYKKPSISVVKNIGGTDTSRFGAAPNLLATAASGAAAHHHHQPHAHLQHTQHAHHSHHHHSTHHLSRQEAAALAAGKGTRPKRGKYRNYDRDSLIEAVRAVQRGEMSVHRAGSYFGVPHSTLEYKVKERHLMRPRKREPKPQPGLDGSSASSSTAKSNSNIPGHNSLDKLKLGAGASANSKLNKSNNNNSAAAAAAAAAFPNAASNGMKLPMFDSAVPLPYTQHLFWQHSQAAAFGQLQMDFNRSASAQGGAAAELLKSHTQRYQEEALRSAGSGGAVAGPPSASTPSPIASPQSAQSAHHALGMKGARELAENIYESGGANGSSILDGIIRKTLDRKSGDVVPASGVGGALRDQLLAKKTTLPYTNNRSNEHASSSASAGAGVKRAGSPLPYTEIKRERTSPAHSSDEDASHSGAEDADYEHNNNNNNNNNNNSSKSNLSGNGGLLGADHHHHHHHHQQRSRLTSRDSETDASSNRSEMLHTHHNHSNSGKVADLNGGGGGALAKLEPPAELGATSILQEKLAQIKAEQESEENL